MKAQRPDDAVEAKAETESALGAEGPDLETLVPGVASPTADAGTAPETSPLALVSETGQETSPSSTALGEPVGAGARSPGPLQSIVDLLHDLAIAVVVCILLITYVVQAFKVQGTSMSPELHDGERILVNKFVYRIADIARGDVVVFWYPEDPELSFIKRVVALPGESVEVRSGELYINGDHLEEDYVFPDNADLRSFALQIVRPGHYFVLGDNRRGSNDSRSWGLVPKRYIYGKAFIRLWPLPDFGFVE